MLKEKCGKLWVFQRATVYLWPGGSVPLLRKRGTELHPGEGEDKRWAAEKEVVIVVSSGSRRQNFRVPQLLVSHLCHHKMKPKQCPSLLGPGETISSSLLTHPFNHFVCSHQSSYHLPRVYWGEQMHRPALLSNTP